MGSFLKNKYIYLVATIIAVSFMVSRYGAAPKPTKNTLNDVLRVVIAGSPHESDYLPFDWGVYKDPSRPEFWADGDDGIMPRPFLKLASEPTIENAKALLAWKKKQWEVVRQVIEALGGANELELYSDILGKDLLEVAAEKDPLYLLASRQVEADTKKIDKDKGIEWSDLKIIYIYRSSCPHCRSSTSFIKGLEELGALVAPLQIDHKTEAPLHSNSAPYGQEAKEYFPLSQGEPTPTFFIKYKGRQAFSHVGKLGLAYLTEKLKQKTGEKNVY